jgi:hypothetical protein
LFKKPDGDDENRKEENKAMGKKRESNFEMLRIIAMIMIVGSHYCTHGVKQWTEENSLQIWSTGTLGEKIIAEIFSPGGMVGVAIFFMLAGFWGIYSKRISILRVLLETVFYGVMTAIMAIILFGFGYHQSGGVTMYNIFKSVFGAVSSGVYWFVSVYVMIMIVSPIINKFLLQYDTKGQILVLIILFVFEYVAPEFGAADYFTIQRGMMFYSLGAIIRVNKEKIRVDKRLLLVGCGFGWILYMVLNLCSANIVIVSERTGALKLMGRVITAVDTDIFVPLVAISLFLIVMQTDIGVDDKINFIAKTTFGIYLIHDSVMLRTFIWDDVLKVAACQYKSNWFFLLMLVSIAGVFIVCALIDSLRIIYIEPYMLKFADSRIAEFKEKYGTVEKRGRKNAEI